MTKIENADNLTREIKDLSLKLDLDLIGIASAKNDLFLEAPLEHQPQNILEGANSVIVIGKTVPKGIFKLNYYRNNIVQRLYHSIYKLLDKSATQIADFLENKGYFSAPIPSYIPLTFRNFEPWGFISLKHAAVAAGLGQIARNGLFIHPTYGTLIRLAAVLTTAEITPDPPFEVQICSECNLCIENCPIQAFNEKTGKFNKMACLQQVVKHGVNILHPYEKNYLKNLELITNTMLTEYAIGCVKCLEVCPLNQTLLETK